MLEYYRY